MNMAAVAVPTRCFAEKFLASVQPNKGRGLCRSRDDAFSHWAVNAGERGPALSNTHRVCAQSAGCGRGKTESGSEVNFLGGRKSTAATVAGMLNRHPAGGAA